MSDSWTLTIEKANGEVSGRYDFANEGAARAGAASYITQSWVGGVRVDEGGNIGSSGWAALVDVAQEALREFGPAYRAEAEAVIAALAAARKLTPPGETEAS